MKNVPGYVTEKIFDCFWAGCVPVYWGASNITNSIPKECFISRADFASDRALYEFMKNMDKTQYLCYLDNIQKFLASEQAQLYSKEFFINTVITLIAKKSEIK